LFNLLVQFTAHNQTIVSRNLPLQYLEVHFGDFLNLVYVIVWLNYLQLLWHIFHNISLLLLPLQYCIWLTLSQVLRILYRI